MLKQSLAVEDNILKATKVDDYEIQCRKLMIIFESDFLGTLPHSSASHSLLETFEKKKNLVLVLENRKIWVGLNEL